MSDLLHLTIIRTDGQNNLPKPSEFAESLMDLFLDGDDRFKDTGVRMGKENRLFFDQNTICAEEAWVIVFGPSPMSEDKLLEIVSKEKLSIWKPRTLNELIKFMRD
jgi:hypothetical protein